VTNPSVSFTGPLTTTFQWRPAAPAAQARARKAGGESRNPYTGDTFLPWDPSMLRDEGAPGAAAPPRLRTGFRYVETSGGSCWSDVIEPCVICRHGALATPVTGFHGKNVGCADDAG
jgi:hypothetical protein